eukprot:4858310-Alexandrium_andersonii.AAC.1
MCTSWSCHSFTSIWQSVRVVALAQMAVVPCAVAVVAEAALEEKKLAPPSGTQAHKLARIHIAARLHGSFGCVALSGCSCASAADSQSAPWG